MTDPKLDLDTIERVAQCAQGRYDPEILAEVGVYHGNAAKFVAEVGTPDVVLALVARIRDLEREVEYYEDISRFVDPEAL